MVTGQTKSSQSRLNLTFFLIPEFLTPKRFQINCPIEDRRPDGRGQPHTVFVVFNAFSTGRQCLIRRELNHLVKSTTRGYQKLRYPKFSFVLSWSYTGAPRIKWPIGNSWPHLRVRLFTVSVALLRFGRFACEAKGGTNPTLCK